MHQRFTVGGGASPDTFGTWCLHYIPVVFSGVGGYLTEFIPLIYTTRLRVFFSVPAYRVGHNAICDWRDKQCEQLSTFTSKAVSLPTLLAGAVVRSEGIGARSKPTVTVMPALHTLIGICNGTTSCCLLPWQVAG